MIAVCVSALLSMIYKKRNAKFSAKKFIMVMQTNFKIDIKVISNIKQMRRYQIFHVLPQKKDKTEIICGIGYSVPEKEKKNNSIQ